VVEKQVNLKLPSVHTVGVFMRNLIATLVVLLTIMGSILFVQVRNETNQIQHEAVVARQVALRATDAAILAAARAGQGTSISLCTSLEKLAALQPPPGNAAANPSRLYEQKEHAILAGLSADLHCSTVVQIHQ
jgi:type II secretory pathway pseudopilin PulG